MTARLLQGRLRMFVFETLSYDAGSVVDGSVRHSHYVALEQWFIVRADQVAARAKPESRIPSAGLPFTSR